MNLKKIFLYTSILIASSTGVFFANATNLHTELSYYSTNNIDDDIIIHTVAKGETVYSIASMYNTTVQQIYIMNPEAEKGIKVGDKLRILKAKSVSGYSNHEIEAKETLYSVARMYNISVDDLKDANPGLNENSFSIGKKIKIPKFGGAPHTTTSYSEYRVQKGETLYSIGREHNVSVESLLAANPSVKDSGLKDGMLLNIPGKQFQQTTNNSKPAETQIVAETASKGETVRVGLFFSFTDNDSSIQKDKLSEYYEGFLLAVKDLKEKGLNAEIYTFEIGPEKNTKKLENLLGTNEVKNLHLMIGGVSKQQIDILSNFSQKTGIKYVIPFGSTPRIKDNSELFQMTTSHSSLYSEIVKAFVKKFDDYNIIFLTGSGSNDKSDFVAELKSGLSKANIKFKTITETENFANELTANIALEKNIFIPSSSSEPMLRRVLATLDQVNVSSLSLFGYPEWQAYTQHTANLHKYGSYIYSIFFLDDQQKETQDIANEYKSWYNRNMANTFPKWGYLGYDTGLYFLTALKQYGSKFDSNLAKVKVHTLQSAINFEYADKKNSGYINNGIYFVHYKTDSGIEKIDISK